jgi:hypothetical protein
MAKDNEPDLSLEEIQYAQAVFAGRIEGKKACEYCGGIHLRACRRVKMFEYNRDQTLRRVVFWQDGSWDDSEIIWPEEVFDEEDADGGYAGRADDHAESGISDSA